MPPSVPEQNQAEAPQPAQDIAVDSLPEEIQVIDVPETKDEALVAEEAPEAAVTSNAAEEGEITDGEEDQKMSEIRYRSFSLFLVLTFVFLREGRLERTPRPLLLLPPPFPSPLATSTST